MKTIAAGQFKARCLRLMDEVKNTREPLIITKNGRAVAKLVPAQEPSADFLGKLAEVMTIVGDVTQPIEDAAEWESAR